MGIIYRNYNAKKRENELIKIAKACKASRNKLFVSKDISKFLDNIDIAEISITSSAKIIIDDDTNEGFRIDEIKDIGVKVSKAAGSKCNRCWIYKYCFIN